jgi:hypothetical protein
MTDQTQPPQGNQNQEKTKITTDVVVEDAHIDWNLSCSNMPELVVMTSNEIPMSEFEPATDSPSRRRWIEENDYGLFFGWQQSLPVSEETGMDTTIIQHKDLGKVTDRYRMLPHVVCTEQNNREEDSVLSVTYCTDYIGRATSLTTRVEVAQEIIDKYINGPLGTSENAYWYIHRKEAGYSSPDKSKFEGYRHYDDVELAHKDSFSWYPQRQCDTKSGDKIYSTDN